MKKFYFVILAAMMLLIATSTFAQKGKWEQVGAADANNPGEWTTALAPNGTIFIGGNNVGIYRSIDNGNSWTFLTNGPLASCIAVANNGTVFAGTWGYGIYRSNDNGETWTRLDTTGSGFISGRANALVINARGDIFVGNYEGVFRSTNNGGTWTLVKNGMSYRTTQSLAIGPDGAVYAGTYPADAYKGGLFRSTDNGDNWYNATGLECAFTITGITATQNSVFAFAHENTRPRPESPCYRSGFGPTGTYRSNNGGGWVLYNAGVTFPTSTFDGSLVASKDSSIAQSTDQGKTWTAITTKMPYRGPILLNKQGQVFVAVSYPGYGIWRFTPERPTKVDDNKNMQVPEKLELRQNYPNPFNPSTTISFSLPKAGRVTLKIYNVIGQEVAALVDAKFAAGDHQVVWDAKNRPSGFYFARLVTADGEQKVRKLILSK